MSLVSELPGVKMFCVCQYQNGSACAIADNNFYRGW